MGSPEEQRRFSAITASLQKQQTQAKNRRQSGRGRKAGNGSSRISLLEGLMVGTGVSPGAADLPLKPVATCEAWPTPPTQASSHTHGEGGERRTFIYPSSRLSQRSITWCHIPSARPLSCTVLLRWVSAPRTMAFFFSEMEVSEACAGSRSTG